ncbi:unnamed protein product [Allacma fusca]|uniref:CRAL-TRIO domain-containing protein n=1 Tax=Allacma fusca TaxID=39272 RepID=A0A8J2KU15_9HEXA|nr:unnamed protein product [Allacma fusca]
MEDTFTPEEQAALKEFRVSISDIVSTYDEYDSHDKNLIRWLRAKDLHVKKAEDMIRKQVKVREETEQLQYLPFPDDLLEKLPFRIAGYDKQGTMVTIIPAGIWEFKKLVLAGRNRDIQLYLSQIFERYFRYMKSTCTVETMKTQVVMIADFHQFSIQENISPPVLSFFIQLLQLFDANCPEMMKTAYAINVPKIFSVGWALIYPFLSQRTLDKVRIIGGGPDKWRKVLLEDIDYRELPSDYGGSNTAHPYVLRKSFRRNMASSRTILSPRRFSHCVHTSKGKIYKKLKTLSREPHILEFQDRVL